MSNKNKYYNFNKSLNQKTNILKTFKKEKKDKSYEKNISKGNDQSKSKLTKNYIHNLKQVNQPLKLKKHFLMDNYCVFNKKKIQPKLPQIATVNCFKIKYHSIEEIISTFSEQKIEYVLYNNILYPNEKYFFILIKDIDIN